MYKIQYLNTFSWVDYCSGYTEQETIAKAIHFANNDPNKRIRVIFEDNGRQSVVFMP